MTAASGLPVRLRPVTDDDLAMIRRFATEPGLVGLNWAGFRAAAWRDGCLYSLLRDDPAAP